MTFDIRQYILEQNDATLTELGPRVGEKGSEGDKAHDALKTIGYQMSQIKKQINELERHSRQYKGWQVMARQLRRHLDNMETAIVKGVES